MKPTTVALEGGEAGLDRGVADGPGPARGFLHTGEGTREWGGRTGADLDVEGVDRATRWARLGTRREVCAWLSERVLGMGEARGMLEGVAVVGGGTERPGTVAAVKEEARA
ncbi:hypothetical protein NDU88_002575 [Pleurodeles waltl]|uniref:Uncharacterized protein n=1 Tax=Pleurodeles waltl TaxID=8319 RepID=A0AAV7WS36_PLEWA|nr:hypothetical protein NDU88_002575 [Pleurodeles waltl]